ncbi:F0F1 ATP synthase subunit B [Thiorhodococcus mannitoliphagus]|uniref:ATP synthase subunit b n=1 Tax=Thiorhodococcus mannitoliphagus TaxID=329406 RepID=A0A6P1DYX3_9GAMM|nr:F0F1 ATP synthase subunit B [Thiorhodococcus mannitoliphagus]NEX21362.1 F0F1 ATP synthase subunit B [Thiorhodococcus mannitoliphagus]
MNINLTLFAQMITFAVFVGFCMKYVWPPIVKALAERKAKIAEGLAAAERGHQEKALGEQRALEVMKEAKATAAEIVGQAQKRATDIVEEAKSDARVEGERIVTAAQAEIERETNRAREELREKVATLAVAAAEKILQKEINIDTHRSIVDDFAKQL